MVRRKNRDYFRSIALKNWRAGKRSMICVLLGISLTVDPAVAFANQPSARETIDFITDVLGQCRSTEFGSRAEVLFKTYKDSDYTKNSVKAEHDKEGQIQFDPSAISAIPISFFLKNSDSEIKVICNRPGCIYRSKYWADPRGFSKSEWISEVILKCPVSLHQRLFDATKYYQKTFGQKLPF